MKEKLFDYDYSDNYKKFTELKNKPLPLKIKFLKVFSNYRALTKEDLNEETIKYLLDSEYLIVYGNTLFSIVDKKFQTKELALKLFEKNGMITHIPIEMFDKETVLKHITKHGIHT